MKKVFISGPMTGYPEFNFPAFYAAEAKLKANGFSAINPAQTFQNLMNLGVMPSTNEECNKVSLSLLMEADAICLLDGWFDSNGASLEAFVARKIGLELIKL